MTALQISPHIVPDASGYTYASRLVTAWAKNQVSRMWALGPRVISAQVNKALGSGIWKALDRMNTLTPELLDDLEALGVKHPSTYADCYHQLATPTARLKHTFNGMFSWWSGGPWEQALQRGLHYGTHYRYDVRSAYRWASTLGLPDTYTFKAWSRYRRPEDTDGLWVAYVEQRADLPAMLRSSTPVVISSEELRGYKVLADVIRGVTWTKTLPADYVDKTLDVLPCSKQSGRAYWGRWIARDKLRCMTPNKEWELPNTVANFVWGWLLVGRVRLKVWQASAGALHVYVDEVVTPHELPVGPYHGDWHLKETYPRGVFVRRTGHYGPIGGESVMQTGVAA